MMRNFVDPLPNKKTIIGTSILENSKSLEVILRSNGEIFIQENLLYLSKNGKSQ